MTEDQLFEKLQSDLQAEIKATAEKAKAVPISMRVGKNASLQTVAEELFLAAYRRVKDNRAHAVATDPVAREEGGSIVIAAQNAGKRNLVPVCEVFTDVIPGWRQQRPPADAGTVPKWPVDPSSGERIRNAWEPLPRARRAKPGDPDTYDHKSQHIIKETNPRLASWMEQIAKNHGVTMAMLDQLEAERVEAEAIRKIEYGDKQWQENKLRPNSGATLTEQNLFARSVENPYLLQLHRQEAKAGSPRCQFDNLTTRMALFRRSPEIREIHKQAAEILKGWQAEGKEKAA